MGQIQGLDTPSTNNKNVDVIVNYLRIYENLNKQTCGYTQIVFDCTGGKTKQSKNHKKIHHLKQVQLCELTLDQVHTQNFLQVTIAFPPVKMTAIMFPVLDNNNDIELVALYNSPESQQLQIGQKLQILKPYYKLAFDGKPLIRIDNPKDVLFLGKNQDEYLEKIVKMTKYVIEFDKNLGERIKQFLLKIQFNNANFKEQSLQKCLEEIDEAIKNPPVKQKKQKAELPNKGQQKEKQKTDQNNSPFWMNNHVQIPESTQEAVERMDQNQLIEQQEMIQVDQTYYFRFIMACQMSIQDLDRCVKLFKGLVSTNPSYAVVHYNLGENAFTMGDFNQCASSMKSFQAIHHKKKFSSSKIYNFSYYHLGYSLMKLDKLEGGEKFLLKAVELEPQNQVFLTGIGLFYFNTLRFEKAENYFLKSAQHQQKSFDSFVETSRAYYYLLIIYILQHNLQNIVKYSNLIIDLDEYNYQFIYEQLLFIFIEGPDYAFQEKMALCLLLKQSIYFDMMTEEFISLSIMFDQKEENQIKGYMALKTLFPAQQELEQTKVPLKEQQEKKESSSTKSQDLSQNIQNDLMEILMPQIEEPQQQQILRPKRERNLNLQMIKQLYKKPQSNYETFKSETKLYKEKYPGFQHKVPLLNVFYIIVFDKKLNLDPTSYRRFKQASLKFANRFYDTPGIKYIKCKTGALYEIKLGGQGDRLICEQEKTITKNESLLIFNQWFTHKQAERFIQNKND